MPVPAITPQTAEAAEVAKLLASIEAKGKGSLTFADVARIEDVTRMGIYQLFQEITGVGFDSGTVEKVDAKEAARRAFANFRMTKAVLLVAAMTGLSQEDVCHFTPQNIGTLYRASMEAYVDGFMIYHGADPAEIRKQREEADAKAGAEAEAEAKDKAGGEQPGNAPSPANPEAGTTPGA